MKRIISERTLVVSLFFAAFIVFFFAQKETRKQERLQMDINAQTAPTFLPTIQPKAELIDKDTSQLSQ